MDQRIVFVSHPLRGALHSAERRADIAALRLLLDYLRRESKKPHSPHYGVIFIAPYLLYGEIREDVVGLRAALSGWEHNEPTELWLFSDCFCPGMVKEIRHCHKRGIKIECHMPELACAAE